MFRSLAFALVTALSIGCAPSHSDVELFEEACAAARQADEVFEAAHPGEFVIRASTCEGMLDYVAKHDLKLARRGALCLRTFTADDVARTMHGNRGRCPPDEEDRARLNALARRFAREGR